MGELALLARFSRANSENTGGWDRLQIAAVARRVDGNAGAYLEQQVTRGSVRHWHRWKPVLEDVKQLVSADHVTAKRVLKAWQDLAIIYRKTGTRE